MAFDSFRDFLKRLETAGELRRITQPLATELEITEMADREMKKPGGGQALLVEQPTVNGQVSPFPLAINTLGSHRRMAMSLGANSIDEAAAGAGFARESEAADQFQRSHQPAGHGPRFAPCETKAGEGRPVQGGRPQVRRPAHAG